MELIAIQKNIMINPEWIISVEIRDKKIVVHMYGKESYIVEAPKVDFLKALSKYGVDLNKQFISV